MTIAQILRVATEAKDGRRPYRTIINIVLNVRLPRNRSNQDSYAADVGRHGGSKA